MSSIRALALQTSLFQYGNNLSDFLKQNIPPGALQEKSILAVTSKIVSLAEKRIIPKSEVSKKDLIRSQADVYLGEVAYGCHLTIKEGLFIPSAGIDESNSEHGDFILYPQNPFESARKIWEELRQHFQLKEFGVILTDSHTSPLRQGVTGICLSYWGFQPVRDLIGTKDLYGRELQMTKINIADALSATAVLLMGEGKECRPLAVIEGAECEFSEHTNPEDLRMPKEKDLYFSFLAKKLSVQD